MAGVDRGFVLHIRITQRQRDILCELIKDGPSNREIGRRLYLTENSVKTHFKRIFEELPPSLRDRTALAVALIRGTVVWHVVNTRRERERAQNGTFLGKESQSA